jgi:hypothetical protein
MSFDEYSSARQRGNPPVFTRVYQHDGDQAHLRTTDGCQDILCLLMETPCCFADDNVCCCGERDSVSVCACLHVTDYHPNSWLGTGSQDEYDQAEQLPLCLRCFAIRERQLPDVNLDRGHHIDLRS